MAESLRQRFVMWRARRRLERAARGDIRARKSAEHNSVGSFLIHSRFVGGLLICGLWLFCAWLLYSYRPKYVTPDLKVGESAPRTIFTDFRYAYEDKVASDQARTQAADNSVVYLRLVSEASRTMQNNFYQLIAGVAARAAAIREQRSFPTENNPIDRLVSTLAVPQLNLLAAMAANESAMRTLEQEFSNILSVGVAGTILTVGTRSDHPVRLVDRLGRVGLPQPLDKCFTPVRAANALGSAVMKFKQEGSQVSEPEISAIFGSVLGPEGNLEIDLARTEQSRREARKDVKPVIIDVAPNTVVVARGAVIDGALLQRIQAYEKNRVQRLVSTDQWQTLLHEVFLVLILIVISALYLGKVHPDAAFDNRNVLLSTGAVMLGLSAVFYGAQTFYFFSEHFSIPPELASNTMPLALASILLAVTLGYRVAFGAGLFISAVAAMLAQNSFNVAIEGMIVCTVASLAVRGATNYRSFFIRILLSVLPTVWIMDFGLLRDLGRPLWLLTSSLSLAAINAFATAMAALISIFLFELIFNVSTNMSLMVLCDYNHPLLERLKREAPGTFFHSLTVATLAEDAAKAIGANPLRAKAGALFHDIGKLFKPQYFTENNLGADNRHQDLTPQVSSIIIRDHVKEGLELAREYHLCRAVRDAIEQHHGTDLVHYFYQQALARNIPVTESQYRYQGELPRTPEIVIVSLADACEAATRSLQKPSASKIEALVGEIFRKREHDGQLDAAEITLSQLAVVRASFTNTLICMKHGRIAYNPETPTDENDLFMARPAAAGSAADGGKKTDEPRV